MTIDVRVKGAAAENAVKKELIKLTGESWERIPLSGSLDAKFGMKGDVFINGKPNAYCVEVKWYAESQISHLLVSGTNPQIIKWVEQAKRQAAQVGKEWLLIFKHNRSKLYVAFNCLPSVAYNHIFVNKDGHTFYIALLEDWIKLEKPEFVK